MRGLLFAVLALVAEPAMAQVVAKPPTVANSQVKPQTGVAQVAKPGVSPAVVQPAQDAKARADRLAALTRQKAATETEIAALKAQIDALQAEKDTYGDLGAEMSTRLRMHQERYSKAMATLSDIMKKMADTQSGIVSNIK